MSVPLPDHTGADPDIIGLILIDHEWFRRRFADLDELRALRAGAGELAGVWNPLAERLDVHAVAEEEIFYPQLLRRDDDAEEETRDAIGDHNDIRDGVRDAGRHPVGTPGWWDAVARAREANDDHMAEEEREGLADFRADAGIDVRRELGQRFARFVAEHPTSTGLDTADRDPDTYVVAESSGAERSGAESSGASS